MNAIAIVPENPGAAASRFVAFSNGLHSAGDTAGAALDALTSQLSESERGTLVVVQHYGGDKFFDANQCRRLQELMARWREARDTNVALSSGEQQELEALVEAELKAAASRATALFHGLGS
jgi:DNA-binding transcriptional regulator YbjK